MCTCPPGFTSLMCNTIVSSCDPNPCPSPYQCVDNTSAINSYYCEFCIGKLCHYTHFHWQNYYLTYIENVCQFLNDPNATVTSKPVVNDESVTWAPYLGIAVGGAILLCYIIATIICCCCYCHRKTSKCVWMITLYLYFPLKRTCRNTVRNSRIIFG